MESYGQRTENGTPKAPESIVKSFYNTHPDVASRSQNEVDSFMKENSISTIGQDIPRPVTTFKESSLPKYLVDQLEAVFEKPSVIQAQTWPVALQGRDMIGIAQTGSGKTLAFIMPAIVHIMAQDVLHKGDGPIVLVIAPTRELAVQIEEHTQKFAKCCDLSSLCVYGGASRMGQKSILHRGVEILIATPGRLLDFLESGDTNLRRVTYLVLDEADRMLDMGFEKDLERIISKVTHPDRQTLMFSATWPKEVQSLAREFCSMAPVQVRIGKEEALEAGGLTINKDITQEIVIMNDNYQKYEELFQLLLKSTKDRPQKFLIFCQTKRGVDELEQSMNNDPEVRAKLNLAAKGIHGDKIQMQRDSIFGIFKTKMKDFGGKSNLLIATDVASRGLDVRDIDMVINYDMPLNIEDYVHRIGRTGRAGDKGTAVSFITSTELGIVDELITVLKQTGTTVPDRLYDMQQEAQYVAEERRMKKQRYRQSSTRHDDHKSWKDPRNNRPSGATNYSSSGNQHLNRRNQKANEKFGQNELRNDLWG